MHSHSTGNVPVRLCRGSPAARWSREIALDLKGIDLTGAPQDVRETMAAIIRAVEENATVRRTGGDTNAANDKVAFAKRDLLRALEKWREKPY